MNRRPRGPLPRAVTTPSSQPASRVIFTHLENRPLTAKPRLELDDKGNDSTRRTLGEEWNTDMIDVDVAQLPPDICDLLLTRGSGVPPLIWTAGSNRANKKMLDETDNARFFRRKSMASEPMAAAVRGLLCLWNGWLDEARTAVANAPPVEKCYIEALCARHTDNPVAAKPLLQQVQTHPIHEQIAAYSLRVLVNPSDPLLLRLKQMLEMTGIWEPFLFNDLYEQARAGRFKDAAVDAIRQIQGIEFEMLFRYCYEAATGEPVPTRLDRASVAAREEDVQRMRRLAEKHRAARRTYTPPAPGTEASKSGGGSSPQTAATGETIRVACPKCQTQMTLPTTARGEIERCTQCNIAFTVPGKKDVAPVAGARPPVGTITVCCPKCRTPLSLPETARGQPEKCGKCGTCFLIPKKPSSPAPAGRT